jgi:hypothetical protein
VKWSWSGRRSNTYACGVVVVAVVVVEAAAWLVAGGRSVRGSNSAASGRSGR